MVPEPSATTSVDASTGDGGSSTLVNALVGAVAGVVLAFLPFSTVLGGGVAGYLEGGTPVDGAKVGAIAGIVMFVPLLLFGGLAMTLFVGFSPGGPPVWFFLLAGFALTLAAIYTVGLGALGGYLGVYVKDEL